MPVAPGTYWDLIERDPPPTKRRANHAKVRTGCATCKSRKVKCDERKPFCGRCEKSGYEDPSTKRGKDAPLASITGKRSAGCPVQRLKSLKPRIIEETQQFPVHLLMPSSLSPAYLNDRDAPFFERLRYQIVMDISIWCGANYSRHILSEIMQDDCIRHAALALSAMVQAVERSPNPSSGTLTKCREGQVALYHYMKAISLCRKQVVGGITSQTVRSNLTSTFFFAMIEILQGNISTVDQIMMNGTILMRNAMKLKTSSGSPMVIWDQQLTDIKAGFDKLTIMWGLCPFFHSQRLIYSTSMWSDQTQIPNHDAPMVVVRGYWTRFLNDLGLFMMSVRCGVVITPEFMGTVVSQKSKFLKLVRQWMSVLDVLMDRERNTSAIYPLSTMKASCLSALVFLSCFLDETDVSYDLHLQSFLEILQICQKFIPEKPPTHVRFSLDIDIFPIVSFTITKCRDQKTRQRALKIFNDITYRQAFWNNRGLMKGLQALVDLENKGRDKKGFIPPSSRYYYVGSEWDIERRQMMANFVCVGSIPTESGDLPTVRVPISF
ncbi:hypothetical protein AAE478_004491 [Parahypoxylon ruwenzoriense]